MRKLLGIGAVVFGVVGVLLCVTAIAIGWWAAVTTTAKLDRVVTRLEHSISEVDLRLASVESRVNVVRKDLNAICGAAESIASEPLEPLRLRAEIEQLIERFVPVFERADALADSLRVDAAGLRTAAEIVDQFSNDPEATVRVRNSADKIDRAAETLNGLRSRVDTLISANETSLTRELVTLAREATAGSERLTEGLAAARQEIAVVPGSITEWRDLVVYSIYVGATACTLVCSWAGLGEICLIDWGRRRFARRTT